MDRLRWCRCSRGLLQAEVAERVGLTYNAYKNLEAGTMQHIPQDTAQRLAELYDIPAADLLDGYNQFLYDGQAARIRTYRESLGLRKKPFARKMGIPIRSLQAWESGSKTITRALYCFANLQISSSGAALPSIEKTPSVQIILKR